MGGGAGRVGVTRWKLILTPSLGPAVPATNPTQASLAWPRLGGGGALKYCHANAESACHPRSHLGLPIHPPSIQ